MINQLQAILSVVVRMEQFIASILRRRAKTLFAAMNVLPNYCNKSKSCVMGSRLRLEELLFKLFIV